MTSHRSALSLKDIEVRYGNTRAVDRVDLETRAGEFIALLGPSGCGKTTLLRVIAGFVRADRGEVLLDSQDISRLSPEERRIGMVFQNYALFPHMSVAENVAYGLRAHGASRAQADAKVKEMLAVVRMEGFEQRLPRQLSGGQQQRVALARALAISPRLLLLDEPLGALDKNLREEMQRELLRIQRELGITTIMVTHDQEEAMAMADRIAVLNEGRIVQFGTSSDIYDAPTTAFVSGFVGNSTLIPGDLRKLSDEAWVLRTAGGTAFEFRSAGPCTRPGAALLALRPEQLELSGQGMAAQVQYAKPMGHATRVAVRFPDGLELQIAAPRDAVHDHLAVGTHVHVRIKPQANCPVFVS
jgi:spermidine/putrescine ABC transporter ATP-binding subunit